MNIYFCLLVLISLAFCMQGKSGQEEWLTIFIHGTVGLRPNLSVSTVLRILKDCIQDTQYEKHVTCIREHPFLFTMQPLQKLGLKQVTSQCSLPCGAYAFASLFDFMDKKYNPGNKNSYYTFGWSGLLSYSQRYIEAQKLYHALRQEIAILAAQNRYPKIRIVAYSHGGNLALNLAPIRKKYYGADNFVIDELITLGMPVQKATACMAQDPLFKKIYHIYSPGDSIQRLDFSSPCNLISHRRFYGHTKNNLTQIEVKVTAELLKHPDICLPQGLRGTINQSPGHTELWFFGWAASGYRRNFALYPLPFAVLTPYIINTAQRFATKQDNHITIDVRPDQEIAIVRHKYKRCQNISRFMNRCEFARLRNKALAFHPHQPRYRDIYTRLKSTINIKDYR